MATSLTWCPACARDTQTLADHRCEYCGQRKPIVAEPAYAAPAPRTSVWDDVRPQLIAAAIALVIAVVGLLAGSTLLLIVAAVLLVGAAVQKIVADGW